MTERILYLDTTGSVLRVGISLNNAMAFVYNEHSVSHRYHSAIMIPVIQEGLKQAGLAVKDLTGLAVNIGPGSFTGLRTGLTTIRTMAQFLHLPVYVFNTFELLACGLQADAPVTHVYLDALRDRAYFATVRQVGGLPELTGTPALVPLPHEKTPGDGGLLMDASLAEHFTGREDTHLISEADPLFTPAVMQRLIRRDAARFRKPWPEISPLYIQQPNITQRKAKSGTLR